MIKFNTVTWYTQVLAIVLAVLIFALGVYVGTQMERSAVTAEVVEG